MEKIKGFLFAVRHREILMTDLGLRIHISPFHTLNVPFLRVSRKTQLHPSLLMHIIS